MRGAPSHIGDTKLDQNRLQMSTGRVTSAPRVSLRGLLPPRCSRLRTHCGFVASADARLARRFMDTPGGRWREASSKVSRSLVWRRQRLDEKSSERRRKRRWRYSVRQPIDVGGDAAGAGRADETRGGSAIAQHDFFSQPRKSCRGKPLAHSRNRILLSTGDG